jgi:hypothetical protein
MSNTRLVPDTVLAPILGVSQSFLQKDRLGKQLIPFYKIGDRCLYSPDEALGALRAVRQGGGIKRSAARRAAQSSTQPL